MRHDTFESECDRIIYGLAPQEIVSANSVAHLAIKTTRKYPMLFLPAFMEDFIAGMPSFKIIQKYEMLNFNNFASFVKSLKLKTTRHKDPNLGAKSRNIKDLDRRKQYQFLSKYTNMLYEPLENLLNYNILQALVSYNVINHTYIMHEDIQDHVADTYHKIKNRIGVLSDKDRADSFERYMDSDLGMKVDDITSSLHAQGYAIAHEGDISVTSEYPKMAEYVYDLIKKEKNGVSYATLQRRTFNKFPLVRFTILRQQIFQNILSSLKSRNIVWKKSFWKYSPTQDQLFTEKNYTAIMERIKKQMLASGRTMFFGRRISPTLFMEELKSLKYGDLDDEDDQVTRIAGLVLSDSAMLQSPREAMEEFDFIVDLENYNFRPEQEEIMRKLDFRVNSTIFHCKVMINSRVTSPILSRLANAVPAGEQGVIFTCMPVSQTVREKIVGDRTIQILNENAIRDWCTITPVSPCRKNSVARVRYGDNAKKVVLVKSLNYESGLATAETIPKGQEVLIPIGSMEEMLPDVSSLDDFEAVSTNYQDFLHLLAGAAQDSFEEGIGTDVIEVYDKAEDLLKSMNPELVDKDSGKYFGSGLSDVDDEPPLHRQRYVRFMNVYAKIAMTDPSQFAECTCGHVLNEGSYKTLCAHLVAGINHVCRGQGDAKTVLKNTNQFKAALARFKLENVKRSVEALNVALGSENHILKSYLNAHINHRLEKIEEI